MNNRSEARATLIFHLTDTLTDTIVPEGSRPKFYWFNDRYHSHIYGDSPGAKYLYLFVVRPHSGPVLFTRHGAGDFRSMWTDYELYLKARANNEAAGVDEYLEPGIVLSFSEIVPSVVCMFLDRFNVVAKTPYSEEEVYFSLKSEEGFLRFDHIPELIKLCPELVSAVPILVPTKEELANPGHFWPADYTNQGRMWL